MIKSLLLTLTFLSASLALPQCGNYTTDNCIRDAEICKDKKVILSQINIQNDDEVQQAPTKGNFPSNFNQNNLINSIQIIQKSCEKFPDGMKRIFENLEIIKISKSGMKEIKKENLKVYKKLKEIDLSENEIKTLDSDLFEENYEIEVINFSGNKLINIGFNFLIPPLKLIDAKFFRNPCTNEAHRQPFDDLIASLRSHCPSTDAMLQHDCVAKIVESERLNNELWVRNGSIPGSQPPANLYAKCTINNLFFHYNEVERLQRELDRIDGKPERPRRCNINKSNQERDVNCISSGNYHPMEQRPMSMSSYKENGTRN